MSAFGIPLHSDSPEIQSDVQMCRSVIQSETLLTLPTVSLHNEAEGEKRADFLLVNDLSCELAASYIPPASAKGLL